MNYNDALNQKIKLKKKEQELEAIVTDYDRLMNLSLARKLHRIKIELNYLNDYMAYLRG